MTSQVYEIRPKIRGPFDGTKERLHRTILVGLENGLTLGSFLLQNMTFNWKYVSDSPFVEFLRFKPTKDYKTKQDLKTSN